MDIGSFSSWPKRGRSKYRRIFSIVDMTIRYWCLAGILICGACAPDPNTLEQWEVLEIKNDHLQVARGKAFDIASPLFSDYAGKYRTSYIPGPTQIRDRWFEYPEGTIFTKTFFYNIDSGSFIHTSSRTPLEGINLNENYLIETRILAKREGLWTAWPYVWDEDQSQATLQPLGAELDLVVNGTKFTYFVPDKNQCAGCHAWDHTGNTMRPLGARPDQLKNFPRWDDSSVSTQLRARAYLDVSCAHCHNASGAADTSGLSLEFTTTNPTALGICKPPVAAGRGATHFFDITPGQPHQSILLDRMQSQELGIMMPELGRSLVHDEGVALIAEWIESLTGECPNPGFNLRLQGSYRGSETAEVVRL